MEEVHGVDVSWLHHPNKEHHHRPPTSAHGGLPRERNASPKDERKLSFPAQPATPVVTEATKEGTPTVKVFSTPTLTTKTGIKLPSLLNRSTQERLSTDGNKGTRRNSWISSISSKFSSQQAPQAQPAPTATPPVKQAAPGASPDVVKVNGTSVSTAQNGHREEDEEMAPYVPSKPKESSSFFTSLTRRLSANQGVSDARVVGNGGMWPRRVLNIDPNRQRCLVPELDQAKLRRVSFCVDVEIAGGPRYRDEEDGAEHDCKKKDAKLTERAEGEALKHPHAAKEEKETDGEDKVQENAVTSPPPPSNPVYIPNEGRMDLAETGDNNSPPNGSLEDDKKDGSRRKEKKKRSEEERKERNENRRRRAVESGAVPVEFTGDVDTPPGTLPATPVPGSGTATPSGQGGGERPTTDPVRIYRRCCQLRETPILKRITEQLMSPNCTVMNEPGVVNCLNLTGSRLLLADVVSLSDWLAVVPVKHLLLEDADLNDEGVRVVLAGLLAAKRPEPTKRKGRNPAHVSHPQPQKYEERAGVVEKLTLNNNPRITGVGWKHISLFLYMCRSIKAIDLAMLPFPDTLPTTAKTAPVKTPDGAYTTDVHNIDAADLFYKSLCQRLGAKLEELGLSECNLTAYQIKKVISGAIMANVARLGLAGNQLDDEGLTHVSQYLRSGICQAVDLGGNDLRGKLGKIAEALRDRADCPCWGLSLAGCNLETADLKALLPTLTGLPSFRFIDLSHNRDLFTEDHSAVGLLRLYMSHMKDLKRIHLNDVGLSPKQAIAIAEVLPEGRQLAHLSILENPQLSALASAKDETSQEEACALYASLMAAVRVSSSIIRIDIDVPSPDNSEVVKALAKQVVAYCLRNLDSWTIAEANNFRGDMALVAASSLAESHGGQKEVDVPDVLVDLVGHADGSSQSHASGDPAPDDDYIVGGTGVVKALQYVLGEKAQDLRPASYTVPGSVAPQETENQTRESMGKAKEMSKNLLGSARKIRARLQPAIVKEATAGDEMAYRRVLFLDSTLQNMVQRFEDEYPECRLEQPSPKHPASVSSSLGRNRNQYMGSSPGGLKSSLATLSTVMDKEDDEGGDYDGHRPTVQRLHSNVSIASRALSLEEGHIHRLGQNLRREVLASSDPSRPPSSHGNTKDCSTRLADIEARMESITGERLRSMVESEGWDKVLEKLGANVDDLRLLQEQDSEAWEGFKESQMKARMNSERQRGGWKRM